MKRNNKDLKFALLLMMGDTAICSLRIHCTVAA